MAVRDILLLGNPGLLEECTPIGAGELDAARMIGEDLRDTMRAFRDRRGWGRAIAAPQIGERRRVVFMDFNGPQLLINPVISEPSTEMIELWDDCMSFPDLLVKVRRHRSCRVTYRDETWRVRTLPAEGALSELLQHEIDHLHGILATMRAVDGSGFALRSQRP